MFLAMFWVLVLCSSLPPLLGVCPLSPDYSPGHPACGPVFTSSQVYPVIHVVVGVVIPLSLMIGWNMRIVSIAKYHQYRQGILILRERDSNQAINQVARTI